jgi:hypothetical protein
MFLTSFNNFPQKDFPEYDLGIQIIIFALVE